MEKRDSDSVFFFDPKTPVLETFYFRDGEGWKAGYRADHLDHEWPLYDIEYAYADTFDGALDALRTKLKRAELLSKEVEQGLAKLRKPD